ncbi:MAG TPA: DUF2268 domain-containing putative Zn-dependent protease [Lysobacter sp.]|nr:DUF2268 domain-containing putative Zn-dependent protease [Lysobacter sp.]
MYLSRLIFVVLCLMHAGCAAAHAPDIVTADVERFYAVYDAAGGAPGEATLQRDYLDPGTPGLRAFIPNRIVSAERLAAAIAKRPEVYAGARHCMAALPGVRQRLARALEELATLRPGGWQPPITVVVGRGTSGGTVGDVGVIIGLEVACTTAEADETPEDRLVHLIAHEYGHTQQGADSPSPTVLEASLREGVAELVAELISGRISNHHLPEWTRGRERELGEAFLRDRHRRDLQAWLYNGRGTREAPGDLGYWVGWRIARRYYHQAADKRAALETLLALRDPDGILQASGWRPGD